MAMRSPVLERMMKESTNSTGPGDFSSSPLSLKLLVDDPYLTRVGLGIAFGHLYASYSSLLLQNDQSMDVDTDIYPVAIAQERYAFNSVL